MTTPIIGLATQCPSTAGQPINAIDVNQSGGYVINPVDPVDQGQAPGSPAATLYVNQVTAATTAGNDTTVALGPGQAYIVIPNTTTPVSVASNLPNHRFTAVQWP